MFTLKSLLDSEKGSFLNLYHTYIPGFWQTIKMGWIQYLSVLVIFVFLMEKVKMFVFENQVITTIIERPSASKNHAM